MARTESCLVLSTKSTCYNTGLFFRAGYLVDLFLFTHNRVCCFEGIRGFLSLSGYLLDLLNAAIYSNRQEIK